MSLDVYIVGMDTDPPVVFPCTVRLFMELPVELIEMLKKIILEPSPFQRQQKRLAPTVIRAVRIQLERTRFETRKQVEHPKSGKPTWRATSVMVWS